MSQPLISTLTEGFMRWQCVQEVAAGYCAETLCKNMLLRAPRATSVGQHLTAAHVRDRMPEEEPMMLPVRPAASLKSA